MSSASCAVRSSAYWGVESLTRLTSPVIQLVEGEGAAILP